MKIKEVIVEAGIGRALAGAATGLSKVFNPQLGTTMQRSLAQGDQLSQQQQIPVLPKIQPTAPIAKKYAPKPLSAFASILPSKVEVVNRNPLVIRYQNNDYHYDYRDGVWKNTAGKVPPDITQDLLAQWGVAVDKFDPLPTRTDTVSTTQDPAVFRSNRPLATVNTVVGIAKKFNDNKWYVGNAVVTNPEDIAKLDQEARETGQLK